MNKGKHLGEFEIIVLSALIGLGKNAYGVGIRQTIAERINRDVAIGAVYATLARLEEKGLVTSKTGNSTPERGGRAKRIFTVSVEGQTRLQLSINAMRRMTDGIVNWSE